MTRTIITALLLVLAVSTPAAAESEPALAGAGVAVGRNVDGRLQAFAVHEGELVTWWQENGRFTPPFAMPVPGRLEPAVSVISGPDGRLHVFARRADTGEIVTTAQQDRFGGFPDEWTSLGRQAGTPVGGLLSSGRIRVVARNARGGVSALVLGSTWQDLGGAGLRDGLAVSGDDVFGYAVVDGVGRIWSTREFSGPEPVSPPAVANGKVYYRIADGSVVMVSGSSVVRLGGRGTGAVVVVSGFAVGSEGVTRLDAPGWISTGGSAAAVDASGVLQVFSRDATGVLRVAGIVPATRVSD